MGRKKKSDSDDSKSTGQRVTRLRRSTRTDAALSQTKAKPKRRKNLKNAHSDGLQTIQLEAIETEVINDIESGDNHMNELIANESDNELDGSQLKRNHYIRSLI